MSHSTRQILPSNSLSLNILHPKYLSNSYTALNLRWLCSCARPFCSWPWAVCSTPGLARPGLLLTNKHPLRQAPLGTYGGWNIYASGFYKGHGGGYAGGFIPFAKTKAERLAKGDPRLSIEERYRDHAGYVAAVKKAAERLSARRFLLPDDAQHLINQAEASEVLKKWGKN